MALSMNLAFVFIFVHCSWKGASHFTNCFYLLNVLMVLYVCLWLAFNCYALSLFFSAINIWKSYTTEVAIIPVSLEYALFVGCFVLGSFIDLSLM